ncbi:MAG: hypothetical protein ACR2JM_13795 [Mycobacterium sp.]
MAKTTGGTAVAERPAETVWLSALPTPRIAAVSGLVVPAVRSAELRRSVLPATGVVSDLVGAVTDLAVSNDGRHLVIAHQGDDAVTIVDIATLVVSAEVSGIAEPYALAAGDRAYVRSASIADDNVVAIDLESGFAMASQDVGVGARGLAVSNSGHLVYVARSADGVADVAVIDVESGHISTITVSEADDASLDTVRTNTAGNRLYVGLTTAAGGELTAIDTRNGRVLNTVSVGTSIGDIAVHPDDRRVFVTGWDAELGGVLRVVDTGASRVTHTIPMDGVPAQLIVTAAAVYVAVGDEVVTIDPATMRIAERTTIGRPVSCLAISRDGSHLFVGDYEGSVASLAVHSAGMGLREAS